MSLDPDDGLWSESRSDLRQHLPALATAEQLALVSSIGITECDAHEKPVELRLGQRKCAELLVRILRRDDEERFGQPIRRNVRADLPFLHRFKKCALRARAG